jgi:hypothetical protein
MDSLSAKNASEKFSSLGTLRKHKRERGKAERGIGSENGKKIRERGKRMRKKGKKEGGMREREKRGIE